MEIITLDKRTELIFLIIGWILIPITFLFFYSNFFERELFLNRKNLYWYLRKNPDILKTYRVICGASVWEFDGFDLNLWHEKRINWSLHNNLSCVVCGFRAGIPDVYYYRKIKKMLEKAEKEFKPAGVI